ncbi:MAG: hypothetical protein ABI443_10120 [Chthoniobacterales bacterium]
MNESTAPVITGEYKNRKTGLVIFGILTLLGGLCCALIIPLMFFAQAMATKTGGAQPSPLGIVPVIGIYGGLAVVGIWLGIGSILARRWARAILLITSWFTLIIGIVMIIFMVFFFPHLMEQINSSVMLSTGKPSNLNPQMMWIIMGVMVVLLGFFFVVLPAAWVFFYRSRHVKATCEARNPAISWTDRCPLPVLAVSLMTGFSVISMLCMVFATHPLIPFFGIFLIGLKARIIYLLCAILFGYLAWAVYRLDLTGWWLMLLVFCLFTLAKVITYARNDPMEIYRLMGLPTQSLAQIQMMNLFGKGWFLSITLIWLVPVLGYLIYVKRFFGVAETKQP